MSVINQVLRDLDARQQAKPVDQGVWGIEAEAVAESRPRLPAITLSVPVLVIALAALFGQAGWGERQSGPTLPTPAGDGSHSQSPFSQTMPDAMWPTDPQRVTQAPVSRQRAEPAIGEGHNLGLVAERPRANDGPPGTAASAMPAASQPASPSPSGTAPWTIAASPRIEPTGPIDIFGAAPASWLSGGPPLALLASAAPKVQPLAIASGGSAEPASNTTPANAGPAALTAFAAPAALLPTGAAVPPPANSGNLHTPSPLPASLNGASANGLPATSTPAAAAAPASGQIERTSLGPIATSRADAQYRQAMQRYHAGRLDEAARLLQAALTEDPRHHVSRQALAAMLIDRREYAQAQASLLEGLAIDPTHASFATMAARLLMRSGDLETAVRLLQAAASERAPAELQATLADGLSRLRRDAEALNHWNSALQRNPSQAGWWLGLAVSLEAIGRLPDARLAFERALLLPGLKPEAADYARERVASAR